MGRPLSSLQHSRAVTFGQSGRPAQLPSSRTAGRDAQPHAVLPHGLLRVILLSAACYADARRVLHGLSSRAMRTLAACCTGFCRVLCGRSPRVAQASAACYADARRVLHRLPPRAMRTFAACCIGIRRLICWLLEPVVWGYMPKQKKTAQPATDAFFRWLCGAVAAWGESEQAAEGPGVSCVRRGSRRAPCLPLSGSMHARSLLCRIPPSACRSASSLRRG